MGVSFCFPHAVGFSAFMICSDLWAFVAMLYCLLGDVVWCYILNGLV